MLSNFHVHMIVYNPRSGFRVRMSHFGQRSRRCRSDPRLRSASSSASATGRARGAARRSTHQRAESRALGRFRRTASDHQTESREDGNVGRDLRTRISDGREERIGICPRTRSQNAIYSSGSSYWRTNGEIAVN